MVHIQNNNNWLDSASAVEMCAVNSVSQHVNGPDESQHSNSRVNQMARAARRSNDQHILTFFIVLLSGFRAELKNIKKSSIGS